MTTFLNHPRLAIAMTYLGAYLTFATSVQGDVFWTSIYAFWTLTWVFKVWEQLREAKAK